MPSSPLLLCVVVVSPRRTQDLSKPLATLSTIITLCNHLVMVNDGPGLLIGHVHVVHGSADLSEAHAPCISGACYRCVISFGNGVSGNHLISTYLGFASRASAAIVAFNAT